jgi:hypothetical protein
MDEAGLRYNEREPGLFWVEDPAGFVIERGKEGVTEPTAKARVARLVDHLLRPRASALCWLRQDDQEEGCAAVVDLEFVGPPVQPSGCRWTVSVDSKLALSLTDDEMDAPLLRFVKRRIVPLLDNGQVSMGMGSWEMDGPTPEDVTEVLGGEVCDVYHLNAYPPDLVRRLGGTFRARVEKEGRILLRSQGGTLLWRTGSLGQSFHNATRRDRKVIFGLGLPVAENGL